MHALLLSTYELGHQPLGLARPAAHLRAAGHQVTCLDLAVQHLDEQQVRAADMVGISVPMHTATRLGARVARRVRALNPAAHLSFYGLYASLNADGLLGTCADSVVGGEFEPGLATLLAALDGGGSLDALEGVQVLGGPASAFLGRQTFALPDRTGLPPLERYSRLDDGQRLNLVGYVEASRGCAHHCRHCPIPPVYGGRLRVVQAEGVLEDVRQLVRLGAQHVTFGDPDFFNGVKHSLRIVEAMHAAFPWLTYDVTIKIEHLLEHRALLPALRETGCLFVVSAVEAIDDQVLAHLQKGHTRADVETALELVAAAGLTLRPTFLPFTPWSSLEGYVELLEFLGRRRLIQHVDPVQLAVRLLVPRGSSLLDGDALAPFLGPFDDERFTYTWAHSDPRVDAVQASAAALVEDAARHGADAVQTFYGIKSLALSALRGRATEARPPASPHTAARVPRLTEPWFC